MDPPGSSHSTTSPGRPRRRTMEEHDRSSLDDIVLRPPQRSATSASRSPQPGIQRQGTRLRRRGTNLTRQLTASTTGRQSVNQQSEFGLAGPQDTPTLAEQHQPYVDPEYTILNPAYEQPGSSRPVWGLAKPMPRVVRPGMVPTTSEMKTAVQRLESKQVDPLDLEKGVKPTLALHKISTQLRDAQALREAQLVDRLTGNSSPISPIVRQSSTRTRPRRGTMMSQTEPEVMPPLEEEDLGTARPRISSNLPSTAEEPTKEDDEHNDDGLAYHSDTDSQLTEVINDLTEEYGLVPAYMALDDEVHNHHTHWSVVRTKYREPLAEFLAVFVQLTLGFCSDLSTTVEKSTYGYTTAWAWGLATMVGIYIAGGISGAHLNPAITIMLYVFRGFPRKKIPSYVFAQLLGAFVAALVSYGIYRVDIHEYYTAADNELGSVINSFVTSQREDWVDTATAFFTEFLGTAFLAIIILALGDDSNAPPGAGMNAFVIGLVIVVLSMAFNYNTGAALNPTRDLGPRLALLALGFSGKTLFATNAYWFYGPWAATILGAIVGATCYDVLIFVGGESPINYPRHRVKRVGKKFTRRWVKRIKNEKDGKDGDDGVVR